MAGIPTGSTLAAGYNIAQRGIRRYEISNHLGNVLTTISDRRGMSTTTAGVIQYYEAEIVSASDYYPFGMVMGSRNFSVKGKYRYGFNGKESDAELSAGEVAFEYRIFDARIAKFFSLDPRQGEYPWQTPYAYYSNSPIAQVDIMGMGGPYEEDKSMPDGGSTSEQQNQAPTENNCSQSLHSQACSASANTNCAVPAADAQAGARYDEEAKKVIYPGSFVGPLPQNGLSESEFKTNELLLGGSDEQSSKSNENNNVTASSYTEFTDTKFPGVIFIRVSAMGVGSGMTLPPIIYLGPAKNNDEAFNENVKMHEYGHFLQFLLFCKGDYMTYMSLIGGPSIASASTDPDNHYKFWTEVSANQLAYLYFGMPSTWLMDRFPIANKD